MIGLKWPRAIHKLARFSSRELVIPMGIEQSIYTPSTPVIALLCVDAPIGRFRAPFLSRPSPLSDRNLHLVAVFRMRGNDFRPYLSIFACATELQHNNESSAKYYGSRRIVEVEFSCTVNQKDLF